MEMDSLSKVLKQTSLAQGLTQEEVTCLAQAGTLQEFTTGTVLMETGTPSNELMVLLQGQVEVLAGKTQNSSQRLGTLGEGAVIGEIGLLLDIPRTATVRSLTPVRAFCFQRQALAKLVEAEDSWVSKVAIEVSRAVAEKLAALTGDVAGLLGEHDKLLKTIEHLSHSETQETSEALRSQILKQAKQLRESQNKVEKQLNYLDTEIQHTKRTRRAAELVIAIVAGGIATLVAGQLIIQGLAKLAEFQARENLFSSPSAPATEPIPMPTIIPYIETREKCDRQEGQIWYGDRCWSLIHRADW